MAAHQTARGRDIHLPRLRHQFPGQLWVSAGRIARRRIGSAGTVIHHRGVSDNHVAERKIILQCPAAADTNQSGYADLAQFFNGDRGGGATDSGGEYQNLDALIPAARGAKLPVLTERLWIIKKIGDAVDPLRVARQQRVPRAGHLFA